MSETIKPGEEVPDDDIPEVDTYHLRQQCQKIVSHNGFPEEVTKPMVNWLLATTDIDFDSMNFIEYDILFGRTKERMEDELGIE